MKYCLNCGNELPENANFCPNCGVTISKVEETSSRMERNKMVEDVSEASDSIETPSRRTQNKANDVGQKILEQLKIYAWWIKNNVWVVILLIILLVIVFQWMSEMVAVVLLLILLVCGYFYANKVGLDDDRANRKLKQICQALVTKIKGAVVKKPQAKPETVVEDRPVDDVPEAEESSPRFNHQTEKTVVKKKTKYSFKSKTLMVAVIVLMLTSYFGPFASAFVAGFATPVTLLTLLKSLGMANILLVLLVGPVAILVGAVFNAKFLVRVGKYLNILAYLYVFYLIYQNEATTSGWGNVINNVHLGWSGYIAVAITILLLFVHRSKRVSK